MLFPRRVVGLVLLLFVACIVVQAAALPWLDIPSAYLLHAELSPQVDSLRSAKAVTPFNYYRLPVCPPSEERIKKERESINLGEILMGNRVLPSNYAFSFLSNEKCKRLCDTVSFTRKEVRRATMFATNDFYGQMYLDRLPLVTGEGKARTLGHPIGLTLSDASGDTDVVLYNHLAFRITYFEHISDGADFTYYIVDFTAQPQVVGPECAVVADNSKSPTLLPRKMSRDDMFNVTYSYSVEWVPYKQPGTILEARSEAYVDLLSIDQSVARKGHWVTALNSTVMVLLLSVVVLVVIVRTIRRDLAAYLDEEDVDVSQDHGWKLVRGDVFRAPLHPVLFTALVASGMQAITIVLLIVLAVLSGLLKSSQRGSILSAAIGLFLFTSCVAGYIAGRMLKFFHKQSWKNGVFATFFCPLVVSSGYLLLNTVNWAKHASLAIPFSYALGLVFMWVCLSLPVGIIGLSLGFKQEVMHTSARVSNIPRLIPAEAESRNRSVLMLCAGALPVVASMLEISYMLSAMWQGQTFYMMGALTLIVFNVFLICAEMGVVVTYHTLVQQDYRWWWPSFTSLASSGAFLFLYTLFYLILYLQITVFSSIILYMGYMAGLAGFFAVMCGTISTIASFVFVNLLYTVVKSD